MVLSGRRRRLNRFRKTPCPDRTLNAYSFEKFVRRSSRHKVFKSMGLSDVRLYNLRLLYTFVLMLWPSEAITFSATRANSASARWSLAKIRNCTIRAGK